MAATVEELRVVGQSMIGEVLFERSAAANDTVRDVYEALQQEPKFSKQAVALQLVLGSRELGRRERLGDLVPRNESVLVVTLVRKPPKAGVAAQLFKASDDSADVRRNALKVLAKAAAAPNCPEADRAKAISAVLEAMQDPEPPVRIVAAKAFSVLGVAAAPHVAQLAALLQDRMHGVRFAAAQSLAALGPVAASNGAGPLVAVLAAENARTTLRMEAGSALMKLKPEAAPHAADVAQVLRSPSRQVRVLAVRILSSMGEAAATSEVASSLALMLREPELGEGVRDRAADREARMEAIKCLDRWGSVVLRDAAADLAAVALQQVKGFDEHLRRSALNALLRISPLPSLAPPRTWGCAADFTDDVAEVLSGMDSDILRILHSDTRPEVQQAAAEAMSRAARLKDKEAAQKTA